LLAADNDHVYTNGERLAVGLLFFGILSVARRRARAGACT
jgi:hypothetical protein